MKIICKIYGAVQEANEIIVSWKNEHSKYYGTPIGVTTILINLEYIRCGCTEVTVPDPCSSLLSFPGYRWMTCGGNDHRVAVVNDDEVIIAFSGVRHGMRRDIKEILMNYWDEKNPAFIYATTEPDWNPWETKNDRD